MLNDIGRHPLIIRMAKAGSASIFVRIFLLTEKETLGIPWDHHVAGNAVEG